MPPYCRCGRGCPLRSRSSRGATAASIKAISSLMECAWQAGQTPGSLPSPADRPICVPPGLAQVGTGASGAAKIAAVGAGGFGRGSHGGLLKA